MTTYGAIALVVVLLWATPSHSQIPVTDSANTFQAVLNVINTAATVTNTAEMIRNQVIDLLPLDAIVILADLTETLATMEAIFSEANGLIGDAQAAEAQVRALFGFGSLPRSPRLLQARIYAMRGLICDAEIFATRVQSLLGTLGSAMGHLSNLLMLIDTLVGNTQGNQLITQQLMVANTTLATSAAAELASRRVETLRRLERDVVVASLNQMDVDSWHDWPTVLGGGR